jgi:hypothetical protein
VIIGQTVFPFGLHRLPYLKVARICLHRRLVAAKQQIKPLSDFVVQPTWTLNLCQYTTILKILLSKESPCLLPLSRLVYHHVARYWTFQY